MTDHTRDVTQRMLSEKSGSVSQQTFSRTPRRPWANCYQNGLTTSAASTSRSIVRTLHNHVSWLAVSFGLACPTEVLHLSEHLRTRAATSTADLDSNPCFAGRVRIAAHQYFPVYSWWVLLQCWGTLRFSEHSGLAPGENFKVSTRQSCGPTDKVKDHRRGQIPVPHCRAVSSMIFVLVTSVPSTAVWRILDPSIQGGTSCQARQRLSMWIKLTERHARRLGIFRRVATGACTRSESTHCKRPETGLSVVFRHGSSRSFVRAGDSG